MPREELEILTGPRLEEVMEATKHIESDSQSSPVINIDNLIFQNDVSFQYILHR